MNSVVLVGNLVADPELRYTQSGKAVANFTIAVSRRSRHNGEWQDVTDGFFRCTAWRGVADNAAASFSKGLRVLVAGRLVQRTFEVEGQRRTTTEIQVQHLGADVQFATVEPRGRPGPPRPRNPRRQRLKPPRARPRGASSVYREPSQNPVQVTGFRGANKSGGIRRVTRDEDGVVLMLTLLDFDVGVPAD